MIQGDRDQVTQVFLNLTENALKYGGPGKPVIAPPEAGARAKVFSRPVLHVDVIDQGDGHRFVASAAPDRAILPRRYPPLARDGGDRPGPRDRETHRQSPSGRLAHHLRKGQGQRLFRAIAGAVTGQPNPGWRSADAGRQAGAVIKQFTHLSQKHCRGPLGGPRTRAGQDVRLMTDKPNGERSRHVFRKTHRFGSCRCHRFRHRRLGPGPRRNPHRRFVDRVSLHPGGCGTIRQHHRRARRRSSNRPAPAAA